MAQRLVSGLFLVGASVRCRNAFVIENEDVVGRNGTVLVSVQVRTWSCAPAKVRSEESLGPLSVCNDAAKQVNFILAVKCSQTGQKKVLSPDVSPIIWWRR
jgi:hypothetical protein